MQLNVGINTKEGIREGVFNGVGFDLKPDWSTVREFESAIAEFFGAPAAVAVDSCTHGLELCLRMTEARFIMSPQRTYVSVPMLADKLNIKLKWYDERWSDYYFVQANIIDGAVYWERGGYSLVAGGFMCLSFQYQKHLSLGRGGMILCPDEASAAQLRKMAYDGREPGIPWREQDIETMGYHYYMPPEVAALGLSKLPDAIATEAKRWDNSMYPDVSKFKVFNK